MVTNKLKGYRVSQGITQPEIAGNMGMTAKTYNHKENGKVSFKIEEVCKLATILGMSIEDVNEIFFGNKLTSRINSL